MEVLQLQLHVSRLDLRQIENVVDEREQVASGAQDALKRLDLVRAIEVAGVFEQQIRHADDGVERSPQLVAHVREELRLVLARGLELPALDLDLAEEARVLDGERGLCREGPQQLNDLRRELPADLPKDGEGAEQVLLADERHREQGSVAGPHERATHPTFGGRDQDVRQLNRFLHLRESGAWRARADRLPSPAR